jgi:serine/threonine-protein kinase
MTAFLTYVVEKTLLGEEEEVKETSIGIEVYGRGESFDPQTDSIVRVEASRLRSKLRDYYLDEGRGEGWRIELPKGGYVPEFRAPVTAPSTPTAASQPATPPASGGRWWSGVSILVVGVSLLAVSAWLGWRAWQTTTPVQVRRIAVLPFSDLSESRELAYFCDGLAEEVIDSLSHVEGVSVLARGSSFRFRGDDLDAREVGRQLQVDRILTGSVRSSDGLLRVSAQLIDAQSGVTIWSNRYDRQPGNELRVQEDISREVARALEVTIVTRAGSKQAPVSAEAHTLFLKGRYHYWRSTPEDEDLALGYFARAIELAPEFAAAHAGLADALASLPTRGVKAGEAEIARARDAATRALALDPQSIDAILAKAHIARALDYDWGEAARLYKKAVQINPGAARPHNSYGVLLSLMGRFEEADSELNQALRLDPLSMQVHTNLVLNLYRQRRFEEAVAASVKASETDPTYRNIYSPRAAALAEMGRFDQALASMETLSERSGGNLADYHLALLGYIHAKVGNRAKALDAIRQLEERAKSRFVARAAFADVYLGLGENDKALGLMEEALQNREILLAGLLVSPHSQALASDPRFISLRRRIAK